MRRAVLATAAMAALVAGCGGDGAPRAPEILFGEDLCDRCRMVISERRHAAAARLDGRELRFDDPGCLLAFLDAQRQAGAAAAWVHDERGSRLAAERARFVEDPERGTPMASGILAFGSAEAAAAAAQRYGGEPLSWAELRGRRAAGGE